MATTSTDLQWYLIRPYHSQIVKRNGQKKCFSAEPGNLASTHTFHNSGLIHAKTCHIAPAKEGKGVVLTLRKADAPLGHIAKAVEVHEFTGDMSTRKTNKAIGELLHTYRPDRKSLAIGLARAHLASQRKPKKSKAPRVRSKKAKAAAATKTS